tara:strand:- start:2735 stop:3586 length:852 start_codon:yes stop_codon:yes gene_type:complete
MKTAILIIGELRFNSDAHFLKFLKLIEGHDVFVSTYEEYCGICSKITDNVIAHARNVDVGMDLKSEMVYSIGAVMEWFHVDSIMEVYGERLLEYDNVLKLRTDIFLDTDDIDSMVGETASDTLYAASTMLFYATSDHFVKTFGNVFQKIKTSYWDKTKRYIPLEYDNILNSGVGNFGVNCHDSKVKGVRFNWLVLPNEVLNEQRDNPDDFNKLKDSISAHYDFLRGFDSIDQSLVGGLRKFPNTFKFSSEQIFAVHAFNSGRVERSAIHVDLPRRRHRFEFGK